MNFCIIALCLSISSSFLMAGEVVIEMPPLSPNDSAVSFRSSVSSDVSEMSAVTAEIRMPHVAAFINQLRGNNRAELNFDGIQRLSGYNRVPLVLDINQTDNTFKISAAPTLITRLLQEGNTLPLDGVEKFHLARAYYLAQHTDEKRSCLTRLSFHPEVSIRESKVHSLVTVLSAISQAALSGIYTWHNSACDTSSSGSVNDDLSLWAPQVFAAAAGVLGTCALWQLANSFGITYDLSDKDYTHRQSAYFAAAQLNQHDLLTLKDNRSEIDYDTETIIKKISSAR